MAWTIFCRSKAPATSEATSLPSRRIVMRSASSSASSSACEMKGGATRTHPVAQANVKLLGVKSAQELAEVIVAVGLAQNTGALRALAAEGIQKGHMSLHARNIAIAAGADGDEIERVVAKLKEGGHVRLDQAEDMLVKMREMQS